MASKILSILVRFWSLMQRSPELLLVFLGVFIEHGTIPCIMAFLITIVKSDLVNVFFWSLDYAFSTFLTCDRDFS